MIEYADGLAGSWTITGVRGPCVHDPDPSWHVWVINSDGSDVTHPRELRWGLFGDNSVGDLYKLMSASELGQGSVHDDDPGDQDPFDWAMLLFGTRVLGLDAGGHALFTGLPPADAPFLYKIGEPVLLSSTEPEVEVFPGLEDRAVWRVIDVRVDMSTPWLTAWQTNVHSEAGDDTLLPLRYDHRPDADNDLFVQLMDALNLGHVAEWFADLDADAAQVAMWLFGRWFDGVYRDGAVVPIWMLPETQE